MGLHCGLGRYMKSKCCGSIPSHSRENSVKLKDIRTYYFFRSLDSRHDQYLLRTELFWLSIMLAAVRSSLQKSEALLVPTGAPLELGEAGWIYDGGGFIDGMKSGFISRPWSAPGDKLLPSFLRCETSLRRKFLAYIDKSVLIRFWGWKLKKKPQYFIIINRSTGNNEKGMRILQHTKIVLTIRNSVFAAVLISTYQKLVNILLLRLMAYAMSQMLEVLWRKHPWPQTHHPLHPILLLWTISIMPQTLTIIDQGLQVLALMLLMPLGKIEI